MAQHLGKRSRDADLDGSSFDDGLIDHPAKRAANTILLEQQHGVPPPHQQRQQQHQATQHHHHHHQQQSQNGNGYLQDCPVSPARCQALVPYRPAQTQLASVPPELSSALQQHLQPQHLHPQPQQPGSNSALLQTGHNDNAALKSVWRSLTPQQKRSLAGMWDAIRSGQFPAAGLLKLPSEDLDSATTVSSGGDEQQKQPHCIIQELDDGEDDAQQQQQQDARLAAGSGPAAAAGGGGGGDGGAAAAAADDSMVLDDLRQPSVEDMELL